MPKRGKKIMIYARALFHLVAADNFALRRVVRRRRPPARTLRARAFKTIDIIRISDRLHWYCPTEANSGNRQFFENYTLSQIIDNSSSFPIKKMTCSETSFKTI